MFGGATQTLNTPTMSPAFKLLDYVNPDTSTGSVQSSCYPSITHVQTQLISFAPDLVPSHSHPNHHHLSNHHQQPLSLQVHHTQMDSQSSLIHSTPSPNGSHRATNHSPQILAQPQQQAQYTPHLSVASAHLSSNHPIQSMAANHSPSMQSHSPLSLGGKGPLSMGGMFARHPKSMQHFIAAHSPYANELTGFSYNDELMITDSDGHHPEMIEDSNCSELSEVKYMNNVNSMANSNRAAAAAAAAAALHLSHSSGQMTSIHPYGSKFANHPAAAAAAAAAAAGNFGPLSSLPMDMMQMPFKNDLDLNGSFSPNFMTNYSGKLSTPKRNSGRKPNSLKDEKVQFLL
jgi:hypothetical protein